MPLLVQFPLLGGSEQLEAEGLWRMAWGPLLPLPGGQPEKSSGIWGSAGYLGESGVCRGHGRGEPRPQAGPDLASEQEYLPFGITYCVCVCVCVCARAC